MPSSTLEPPLNRKRLRKKSGPENLIFNALPATLATATVAEEAVPTHAQEAVRGKKRKLLVHVEDWRAARRGGSLVHACAKGTPVCKWRQSSTKGFFKKAPVVFDSVAEALSERSLCRGCRLLLPADVSKEVAPFL